MSVKDEIEVKLAEGLSLSHMEVINESSNHNVPAGSESHFKLVLVSEEFAGKGLLARHRSINALLANELQNKIHALAIHAYTASEWADKMGNAPLSPPCLGGGKPAG